VATIREWAEAGTHGYRKGVTATPSVGSLMLFPGDAHSAFVSAVDKAHGTVTVEEGNANGAGGVVKNVRKISEGKYANPIYHTGAQQSTKVYQEAAKEAEHLTLTAAQRAALHSGVAGAGEAHGIREHWAEAASESGGFLSARQAKWALQKPDLTTAGGQKTAHDRDEQAVLTKQSEKKYQQRELRAIQAEAKNWAKVRDSYLKLARHAHGGAKKEAVKKASEFDAKLKQAQIDAKAMQGSISDTETGIVEAENVLNVTLPEEIAQAAQTAQSGDLGAYEAANAHVDMEARAELISPAQAKAAKEANARKALSGGYGALGDEGTLKVKGDLAEFSKALESATNALEAHDQILKEVNKSLTEFLNASDRMAQVENGTLVKAMADLISGQIGGKDYHGRAITAGSGSAARY
jgi:hypothetical protein